jgi:lipid A 4'-phosphatase
MNRDRLWMTVEAAVLLTAGILAAWLFERHPIDLAVAHLFYDPADTRHGGWPWADVGWVKFVNDRLITIMTIGATVGTALLWLLGGRRDRRWRFAGMVLFLSLAIGPGLIVNGVLKSAWGRPVPRDVVDFGGHHAYRHISNPGISGPPERGGDGRSFPSGHVSIAAWTSAFYFLLRRRRPRLAASALAGALALSALVAFTRMAAGRHFISDVVWSAIIVLSVNWVVYHTLDWWRSRRAAAPEPAVAPVPAAGAAFVPAADPEQT